MHRQLLSLMPWLQAVSVVVCQANGQPLMVGPAPSSRPAATVPVAGAQAGPASGIDPRRVYFNDPDALYNRQAEVSFEIVADLLDRFRPQLPEPRERKTALLLLDGIFHEPWAPKRPAVQAFHHQRISQAAKEITGSPPSQGALIWKLYDHAFVVRTPTVTLAFDLTRGNSAGAEGFAVSDEVVARIVDQCDVLFISHPHGDHADEWVAGRFIEQGKPVVATPELWPGKDLTAKITIPRRQAHVRQPLPLANGGRSLDVVAYPGHQGNLPNNVVLVFTPEGLSFCHTGDQANGSDFEWIDKVAEHHRVDVLMPNCWTPEIARVVRGVNPAIVITGHENELGHSIDHREAYWLTYDRTTDCNRPVLIMTWGESYRYSPIHRSRVH
ncbi:MAG: MBL fold metallo-hydrolase [Planctomycetes bacterium]|nr:MBL fold metallo-hydrolase [Planctomycetota bacterium]